jgi:predicted RNase H-like nuclease
MHVIGVDACKGGWVAVSLTDGAVSEVRAGASLGSVISGQPEAVGIDMPLGLLATGWREADRQAQRLLGPRRSSVFAIAPRAVWAERDYAAANRLCRELTGKGLSVQAWNLRPKLLEANEFRSACRHQLFEVHPELAFAALAGQPLGLTKHGAPGRKLRRELLAGASIVIPGVSGTFRVSGLARVPGVPGVPMTDVLDAAAAAWSAQRIATGRATVLPDPPEHDDMGQEIAIRY